MDGLSEHLIWDGGIPALFRDRKSAKAFIKSKYGYIMRRPDLRAEPHGWRLPMAVRVVVKPNVPAMPTASDADQATASTKL